MSILVAGNAVLDVQLAVDDDQGFEDGFSGRNVGFLSQPPNVVLGGNGAATAYALGRMGIPVTLNTTLGEDPAGDLIRSWLTQAEVSLAAPSSSSSAITPSIMPFNVPTTMSIGPGLDVIQIDRTNQEVSSLRECIWRY